MDIFVSLKSIINRINKMDIRSRNMFIENISSANPFAFTKDKAVAWVENPKNNPQCDINFDINS